MTLLILFNNYLIVHNYIISNTNNFPQEFSKWKVVKVLDCDIVVSEFELQSHYDVHFQTSILWYMRCKQVNTKILQKFWLILVVDCYWSTYLFFWWCQISVSRSSF